MVTYKQSGIRRRSWHEFWRFQNTGVRIIMKTWEVYGIIGMAFSCILISALGA